MSDGALMAQAVHVGQLADCEPQNDGCIAKLMAHVGARLTNPSSARPVRSPVNRLGEGSAWTMVAIGGAYAIALAVGFATYGVRAPITDPLLAVMEGLTLLSAPALVILIATLHGDTPPARRLYSALAFGFTVPFAGLTTAVHFVELTALRQLGTAGIVWPSVPYALELLAWDGFLGLALLCAAASLPPAEAMQSSVPASQVTRAKQDNVLRRCMQLAGVLCLAGLGGPAVGQMRWQLIGVFGYAAVLPVVCYLLARRFRHAST